MSFTINRTVAVALATIAFLTFNSARSVAAGASASDNSETPGVAQSDDGSDGQECKNIKELETLFRGKEIHIHFYEGLNQLVERAIQEGEKNPKAAKELVDFTAEDLYLNRLTRFLRLQYAIQNARKNESSVFRRDDVFEKLSPSINYFKRFEEAYKAEGVEGVDKALDQFALDVQKDPKLLVDYEYLDEMMTGTEDDDILRFNSQKLGDKFKKIVAAAVLRELQKNRELVPMPANDFFKLFVDAIPKMKDAEFADDVAEIWFIVAFEDNGKRDDGYRMEENRLGWALSAISEERADAFTERVVASLKAADFVGENSAARLVLWEFYLKMKKAADEGDSEGFDNVVAALVEWEKNFNPRAVRGGFDFAAKPAELVFNRYGRKIRDFVESEDFEKLEETIAEIVALEKMFPSRALSPRVEAIMRELEVVRPDLAFQVYDEAFRTCRERNDVLNGFYMQTAAFYCESIDAILDADLEKLEKLADKLAERANKSRKIQLTRVDRSFGQPVRVLDIETDYLYYQRQTYAWKFHVHYGDSLEALEFLDRAISALEKSDKPNAKLFRELLIDVRNDPNIPDRDRRHFEQNAPPAESDDADCKEFKAFKTAMLEKPYSSFVKWDTLFDAALQAGEKNPQAAEKLVDFVAESLYLTEWKFSEFRKKILKAGENESSPFHRDELLEKLRYQVEYPEYYKRFGEAYNAEGVAGLEKVLDQYAQDVQKDPKYLAFSMGFDELLTYSGDDVVEGYGRPELGYKLQKIVADAYYKELRTNPDLVPMSGDRFMKIIKAFYETKDAELAEKATSIWFAVAFAGNLKINQDYRGLALGLEYNLSLLDEEEGDAFTERVLAYYKTDESFGDGAKLVFQRFQRKIKKAIDAGDSKGLENIVADLLERAKEFKVGSVCANFEYILRDLEVVRPDLAYQAYDEAAKRCRDRKEGGFIEPRFYMETAAFYCASIGAILDANRQELERIAEELAVKTLDSATVTISDGHGVKQLKYISYQLQTYLWKFQLHFENNACEVLDPAILALEKTDKYNAKVFRNLLIAVRNNPHVRRGTPERQFKAI